MEKEIGGKALLIIRKALKYISTRASHPCLTVRQTILTPVPFLLYDRRFSYLPHMRPPNA